MASTESSGGDSTKTFFLKHKSETKKVSGCSKSVHELANIFKSKFVENEAIQNVPTDAISFYTKDEKYNVLFKVEEPSSQIYDGALVEVKIPEELLGNGDISRELEEMKRKIKKLENKEDERTTKKRRVDAGERYVVRIRGLPWEATIKDIEGFFREQAIVDEGITMVANHQGRTTGEAFVEFPSKKDLDGALKKDRHHMGHRYIEVYRSTAGEADRARDGQGNQNFAARRVPVNESSAVIRMRGLPFAATEADVYNFFDKLHCVAVHLPKDHLGRPSGDAFVEFSNDYEASEALGYNKKHMGHRYVELFRSNVGELCHAMGVNVRTGSVAADTDKCLRMQGLPWNCVEMDITRFFQDAKVTPTRIHRKSDGGEAYCEFATVEDANRAMSRHKQYIGRRYIELFRVSYIEMAKVVGLPLNSNDGGYNPYSVSGPPNAVGGGGGGGGHFGSHGGGGGFQGGHGGHHNSGHHGGGQGGFQGPGGYNVSSGGGGGYHDQWR